MHCCYVRYTNQYDAEPAAEAANPTTAEQRSKPRTRSWKTSASATRRRSRRRRNGTTKRPVRLSTRMGRLRMLLVRMVRMMRPLKMIGLRVCILVGDSGWVKLPFFLFFPLFLFLCFRFSLFVLCDCKLGFGFISSILMNYLASCCIFSSSCDVNYTTTRITIKVDPVCDDLYVCRIEEYHFRLLLEISFCLQIIDRDRKYIAYPKHEDE